jgi:hypothetical protein
MWIAHLPLEGHHATPTVEFDPFALRPDPSHHRSGTVKEAWEAVLPCAAAVNAVKPLPGRERL